MGAEQREPVWLVIIAALVIAVVAAWLWRPNDPSPQAPARDSTEPDRVDAVSMPQPDRADAVTALADAVADVPAPLDATPDSGPPDAHLPADADLRDISDIVEDEATTLTLSLASPTARAGEAVEAVVDGRGQMGEIALQLPGGVRIAQRQSSMFVSIVGGVTRHRRTLTLHIVADEGGRFHVGPAVAPLGGGGQVESGVVSLTVR